MSELILAHLSRVLHKFYIYSRRYKAVQAKYPEDIDCLLVGINNQAKEKDLPRSTQPDRITPSYDLAAQEAQSTGPPVVYPPCHIGRSRPVTTVRQNFTVAKNQPYEKGRLWASLLCKAETRLLIGI